MKVSIITINRNNAAGLARTIASIAAQVTMLSPTDSIEHIIVDGESTDGSLDNLDPNLPSAVIIAPPNGVYNAINVGIKAATGDIVGLLHAGDVYAAPDSVSLIVNRFRGKDKPDFIWGDVTIGQRYFSGKKFTPEALITGFAPPHPSLYIRRRAMLAVGFYNETYKVAADFEYFLRLFHHTGIAGTYLPGALVTMEPGGLSHKFVNRIWTNNRERLRALRSHNLPASPLRLISHYKFVINGYLINRK